jgi:hypothetical protein
MMKKKIIGAQVKPVVMSFYHGVMAALDVIYSFDQDPTAKLPVEVIRTMNTEELLKAAKSDEYHNLPFLKKTIRAAK